MVREEVEKKQEELTMDCDCRECLRKAWVWLDGEPGFWGTLLMAVIILLTVAWLVI